MWAKFSRNASTSTGSSIMSRWPCSPGLGPRRTFYHGSSPWEISKVSPIHLVGFPGLCIMLLSWAPDLERFLPQHHYPNHWVWLTTFLGFQLHVLEVMAQSPAHTSSFLFILASFPCLIVLIPCFPHTGCKAFALKTGSVSFSFFKAYSLPH